MISQLSAQTPVPLDFMSDKYICRVETSYRRTTPRGQTPPRNQHEVYCRMFELKLNWFRFNISGLKGWKLDSYRITNASCLFRGIRFCLSQCHLEFVNVIIIISENGERWEIIQMKMHFRCTTSQRFGHICSFFITTIISYARQEGIYLIKNIIRI